MTSDTELISLLRKISRESAIGYSSSYRVNPGDPKVTQLARLGLVERIGEDSGYDYYVITNEGTGHLLSVLKKELSELGFEAK